MPDKVLRMLNCQVHVNCNNGDDQNPLIYIKENIGKMIVRQKKKKCSIYSYLQRCAACFFIDDVSFFH